MNVNSAAMVVVAEELARGLVLITTEHRDHTRKAQEQQCPAECCR